MLANSTFIKLICASLLMLFINGCANTQVNNDKEALKNVTRGAVSMMLLDHHMYKNAKADLDKGIYCGTNQYDYSSNSLWTKLKNLYYWVVDFFN